MRADCLAASSGPHMKHRPLSSRNVWRPAGHRRNGAGLGIGRTGVVLVSVRTRRVGAGGEERIKGDGIETTVLWSPLIGLGVPMTAGIGGREVDGVLCMGATEGMYVHWDIL